MVEGSPPFVANDLIELAEKITNDELQFSEDLYSEELKVIHF
jgi:hypothetical protein